MKTQNELSHILKQATEIAVAYYELTGKPLGITGEVGEYWAAEKLGLRLALARTPGYDAIDSTNKKIQIKSRLVKTSKKLTGQRIGKVCLDAEWDTLLLVLMEGAFEPFAIYEASKDVMKALLEKTQSAARRRGALGIMEFKNHPKTIKRWPVED